MYVQSIALYALSAVLEIVMAHPSIPRQSEQVRPEPMATLRATRGRRLACPRHAVRLPVAAADASAFNTWTSFEATRLYNAHFFFLNTILTFLLLIYFTTTDILQSLISAIGNIIIKIAIHGFCYKTWAIK